MFSNNLDEKKYMFILFNTISPTAAERVTSSNAIASSLCTDVFLSITFTVQYIASSKCHIYYETHCFARQ